jgi:pimeloyl-ACP methyl ester carboxylesterase
LNDKAQKRYEDLLCAAIGATLAEMDGNSMYRSTGYPLHVIHCTDDAEVAIDEARRYLQLSPQAQLTELSGLGHRRILYSPRALEALTAAVAA